MVRGIDPVLDYDPNAGEVDTRSVEAILKAANEAGYTIAWTLETHAHADHLSGSPWTCPALVERHWFIRRHVFRTEPGL